MNFSVGDIVEAKPNSRYKITNNGWKGVVAEIVDKDVMVVVGPGLSNGSDMVDKKHFTHSKNIGLTGLNELADRLNHWRAIQTHFKQSQQQGSGVLIGGTVTMPTLSQKKIVKKAVKKAVEKIEKKKVEFDSVILEDEKKQAIKAAISQLDHHDTIFSKWGFEDVFEKGTAVALLFYGVPGTGKTLMGQAIADMVGQKLLIVGPAEIETSTPGGAERNIKRFFKVASGKTAPETGETNEDGKPILGPKAKHVLLFDECDSLITNRDTVGIIMRGQINTLLSELEYYEGIVIFTTNSIKSLDPAMERRITTKIEFEFPGVEARKKIWARMIPKKAPVCKDVDINELAEFKFSGGNIKNIVLNAARHAAYTKLKSITYDCFVQAMEQEAAGMKAFEATNEAPLHRIPRDLEASTRSGAREIVMAASDV